MITIKFEASCRSYVKYLFCFVTVFIALCYSCIVFTYQNEIKIIRMNIYDL